MDDRTVLMSAAPLEAGYQISCYTIREVLGKGGFGITYLAHDNSLDRAVAIKEYLPTSFANRHGDQSVKPVTADQGNNFAWGLDNFLKEAKTLAKFNHDNIVRVHTVFEANNTAYMVMEYEHGEDLASIINKHGSISQDYQKRIFYPIIDGLNRIHELGFVHRDIKPSNIYIRENGSPVLIDFGSARQTSLQQTNEFTALISQGYTPLEQYSADYGDQGPWTDIYSLAATIYHGITGHKPDDSLSRSACMLRSQPDRVKPLSSQTYSDYEQQFLDATYAGLCLQPELRPESLTLWLGLFNNQNTQQPAGTRATGSVPMDDDRTRLAPVKTNADVQGRSQTHQRDDRSGGNVENTFTSQPSGNVRETRMDTDRTTDKEIFSNDDFKIPPNTARPTQATASAKSNKNPLLIGIGLLIAAAGAGTYFFLSQEKPTPDPAANTTANVEPEPLETAVVSTPAATTAVANTAINSEPTTPAMTAKPPEENLAIFFDKPIATDYASPPRSIAQLSKSSPTAPPFEGLDESAWKEQDCSNCHKWTQDSLCTQGQFYVSKGNVAVSRIDHPFGGFFKSTLRDWATQGCQ